MKKKRILKCDLEKGCGEGFDAEVVAVIRVGLNPDGTYRAIYDDSVGGDMCPDPFDGHVEIREILEASCGCCGSPVSLPKKPSN